MVEDRNRSSRPPTGLQDYALDARAVNEWIMFFEENCSALRPLRILVDHYKDNATFKRYLERAFQRYRLTLGPPRIFIGNLGRDFDANGLERTLEKQFGKIEHFHVPNENGHNKGAALVTFRDHIAAGRSILKAGFEFGKIRCRISPFMSRGGTIDPIPYDAIKEWISRNLSNVILDTIASEKQNGATQSSQQNSGSSASNNTVPSTPTSASLGTASEPLTVPDKDGDDSTVDLKRKRADDDFAPPPPPPPPISAGGTASSSGIKSRESSLAPSSITALQGDDDGSVVTAGLNLQMARNMPLHQDPFTVSRQMRAQVHTFFMTLSPQIDNLRRRRSQLPLVDRPTTDSDRRLLDDVSLRRDLLSTRVDQQRDSVERLRVRVRDAGTKAPPYLAEWLAREESEFTSTQRELENLTKAKDELMEKVDLNLFVLNEIEELEKSLSSLEREIAEWAPVLREIVHEVEIRASKNEFYKVASPEKLDFGSGKLLTFHFEDKEVRSNNAAAQLVSDDSNSNADARAAIADGNVGSGATGASAFLMEDSSDSQRADHTSSEESNQNEMNVVDDMIASDGTPRKQIEHMAPGEAQAKENETPQDTSSLEGTKSTAEAASSAVSVVGNESDHTFSSSTVPVPRSSESAPEAVASAAAAAETAAAPEGMDTSL